MHIDITAGADLGRQREKGMEKEKERRRGRDLIPSKLSADLLSLRDMVMPLAPVQCSVKKRGLGGAN